jgi:hypothetical protein
MNEPARRATRFKDAALGERRAMLAQQRQPVRRQSSIAVPKTQTAHPWNRAETVRL